MMQCRMCSQRLPRPGRLCRECDRELERARHAGVSIGEAASAVPSVDGSPIAVIGWRVRAPGPIIAAAFSVGVVAAIALHVIDKSEAAVTHGSVMLDTAGARASRRVSVGEASPLPVSARGEVPASAPAPAPVSAAAPATAPAAAVKMAAPLRAHASRDAPIAPREVTDVPAHIALAAPASGDTRGATDVAGSLGDALALCAGEHFIARPACEERARARYCTDAAAPAQCATPEREHGQ